MNEREQIALAITNDKEKADLLLKLIDMSMPVASNDFEGIKMNVEPSCPWNHNGECWLDIPDSVRICKGLCPYYEAHVLLHEDLD